MTDGMYHIGVTGSRYGATDDQADEVYSYLRATVYFRREHGQRCALHHGDVGFDAEAAEMGRQLGMWIVGHPPLSKKFRAYFPSDEEREPKGYHARDRDIVDACAEMVAAPKDASGKGGTWYTVTYAEQHKIPVLLTPFHLYADRKPAGATA